MTHRPTRGMWSSRSRTCLMARVERRTGSGVRRPDLYRRCRPLPERNPARSRDRRPVPAQRGPVPGGPQPAAPAAELIGRYWHDAFIQIDDFTNEGVAASSTWPFQTNVLQASGEPIDKVVPVEGATGMGGYHDDELQRPTPQLRLHVDGVLAEPEAPGRPGGLVRHGAGRPRMPVRATSCSARTVAPTTGASPSTRSCSGRRRPTIATGPSPRGPASPTTSGSPTTWQ